ncbi:MAG: COG1361 S-layer family protein, partial [Nitrosotalea sp.]
MIYKTILLIAIFLAGQLVIPSYAQSAPEQAAPGASPFEHGYTDIKFLDAYFGYPNQKIEVQPGDQNVPFTILFSNVGTEDIAGISGLMSLPAGFSSATPLVNGLIEADNSQTATSGSSFTLTFYVNLDKSVVIHNYSGTVELTYSRVRENGVHQSFYDFDFKVTGKSVLNMKAENPFIQPGSNNEVTVQVLNNGTSPLNNVDVTISPLSTNTTVNSESNLQNVVIDQHHWNISNVVPGSSKAFSFNIFVPPNLSGQTLHIPMSVVYFDGQGNQITDEKTVDLIIGAASLNFNVKLSTPSYVMMGVMQNLTLGLQNLSPSKISNIAVTLTPSSSDFRILDDPRWYVEQINPLDSTTLNIPVFADQNIANEAVNFNVN